MATSPGRSGLWVRQMDGTAARLLAGTAHAKNPFWSPDSRSLAYEASGKLWRVEAAGGSPIEICDVSSYVGYVGGDWAADGTIVFSAGPSGLRLVPASGGTPQALTTPDVRGGIHLWPQLLPGGRILFLVQGEADRAGIYVTKARLGATNAAPRDFVRLEGSASNGVYAAGYLLWLRGSTLLSQRFDSESLELSGEPKPIADPVGTNGVLGRMVVTASNGQLVHGRPGGVQLSWLDGAGKPAPSNGTLGQPDDYASFRLSNDGRRVAVDRGSDRGRDLWMVDVERDAWNRFTFLPGTAMFPVWSPDGKEVMFRAGFPYNLYRKETSGVGAEQRLTTSVNNQWPDDWSRDGRFALYDELAPDTQRDLWVLPVTPDGKPEPGAQPRPYLRTRFNEYQGRFSPEPHPRWVAYTWDETGRNEVYVQAFPEPRGNFQISTAGGAFPEWSPDGREVYYTTPDGRLMAVALNPGPASISPSPPRELFRVPPTGLQSYAVAPDGKRFLVRAPAGGSQPLELIVNWPALLRQVAPPK